MKTKALTAETQFAPINGNQIAFRVFGEGRHLLFYNRFRGILDTWDPLFLDLLAQQHTIVIFDYPGVGESTGELPTNITEVAAAGIALMDYLQVDQFNIAGWSYGGMAAQAAMFQNQQRVLKAVLIGTNPPGHNEIPLEPVFLERALKPVNDLDDEYVLFFEPLSEKSRLAGQASHQRIAQRLDRNKIPATPERFQRYFEGGGTAKEDKHNFRGQYKILETPVLVISGDHDVSFAVENWFALLRQAPSMQHIIFNATGHAPQHQHAEATVGYMNVFLGKL